LKWDVAARSRLDITGLVIDNDHVIDNHVINNRVITNRVIADRVIADLSLISH
jgi:hypothetical protein